MRFIYVKVGFYIGSGRDFSLSVTLETDFGAVIDLWGEYFSGIQLRRAILNILGNSIRVLSRMHKKSFREIQVMIEEVLKNNVNIDMEEVKDYVSMLLEKYGLEIESLDIVYMSFGSESRYNSLARKAYESRGRYPPIIKASK